MSILFKPGNIGKLRLKNRFVRSSTAESMAGPNGEITPSMLELYEALAMGGAACIFLGHAYVDSKGQSHPKMTGMQNDSLIPGMRKLGEVVHRHDCRVFAQLNFAGARVQKGIVESVGPSSIPSPFSGEPIRELSDSEIRQIVAAFGNAAGRVKAAGLDGILIHGGHGYLASFFSSPLTNKREDDWGGTFENRFRFLKEVYGSIRKAVGVDYPVAIKLGIKDDIENGLSIDDGSNIAAGMAELGIDAIEISGGIPSKGPGQQRSDIVAKEQEAYFLPYGKSVRNKTEKLPLILVGGMRSPRLMEEIINSKWVDFVSLARPFICEPDLVNKIEKGRWEPLACDRGDLCRIGFASEGLRCRRPQK
ncbi:NADH:flavin oxidoreductase [Thermodesulfobacteriota bacterium]